MPEPITLLVGLAGIIMLGFVFSTIDVVKDAGRTIALVLLAVVVVLMSDRLIPWFQQNSISFDRLPELRNLRLNPFAPRVMQPGWQDLPYLLSNQPPPIRPAPAVPPRRPSGTSSAVNNPQTVEPYLNGGVVPPAPVVPPYSNQPVPVPPAQRPGQPVPAPGQPIPALW